MRHTLFPLFAAALLLPSLVGAQAVGNVSAFTVSVAPLYPAPRSEVTLSMISSTLDLTSASMAVSVAGKEIYRGNVQPVDVLLGNAGSITSVRVTLFSAGTNYSQTLSLQPQDVVLIAEPISSAPPLYPGKPLVPLEGDTRIVAMANLRDAKGKVANPATYAYAWTVDGMHIARASGIGKDTILVASPLQYRTRLVSVAVASADGSLVGGDTFSIAPTEPVVRIYENDPLLGIRFDRALSGTHTVADAEDTLFAAPFSLPTTSGAPLIEWFLNGVSAQTGATITLRPTGKGQGSASLSLVASAEESAQATADLPLLFGSLANGFSFFGL